MYDEVEIAVILKGAPRFDSIAHAVYWLRRFSEYGVYATTWRGSRPTEHIEIHLAQIYALAEVLYREQNSYGI